MSGRALQLAAGLTRGWVRVYTRGLPADLRSARRAELESDLWEHAQANTLDARRPAVTALEVMGRLATGVPADLSWRHEHRAVSRRAPTLARSRNMVVSLKNHGMTAVAGALGIWLVCMAALAAFDQELSPAGRVLWPIAAIVAGLLILVGLLGMRRNRRGARAVLASGAILGGMMSIWAIVPAVAAAAIVFWLYGPRRMRRAPTQPV